MASQLLCLLLLCWLAGSHAQNICILITPSVLHVDNEETIMIDGRNSAFDADVEVVDFPLQFRSLVKEKVSVNAGNQFIGTMKIKIPSNYITTSTGQKKTYVTIKVKSPSCSLSKIALVSTDPGYIFIQTDKTIYAPGSTVLSRFYAVSYNLKTQNKPLIIRYQSPDNMIVREYSLSSSSLTVSNHILLLDNRAMEGVWTISARFENFVQEYTAHFEVKDYVHPDVYISIKPRSPYYYIQDQDFTVEIQATYINGNPVNGDAFVLFGVKKDKERKHLPDSLRRTKINDSEGKAILEKKDLQKAFRNEEEMMAWTLYVSVTVITDSGAGVVKAGLENIPIVKMPHQITFTKTPSYFKPGLPFDFMVKVTSLDGSPTPGIPVVAQPGPLRGITQEDGTVRLTLNTETNMNHLQTTVKTEDPALLINHQAITSMSATAYKAVSGNYLHLSITGMENLRPGKNIGINFNIRNVNPAVQSQISHFTYLVLSRGQIIKVGRQQRKEGQTLVTLVLPVTWEFLPSFRFVAYYVVTTGSSQEIVSDSVWIDVEDSCMSTLEITDKNRRNMVHNPGSFSRVKMTADYKALVGLLIVDKVVYQQNPEFWLSQKKVWDIVGMFDLGCDPGAGVDGLQVFYDAGLALQSSFGMETAHRSEYLCKGTGRRGRRSISGSTNLEVVSIRTEFQETWWWRTEIMNMRPERNGVSTKDLNQVLRDTVTTWQLVGVSLVEGKGICVAAPYEIKVMKDFYIELKLPYAMELNKQVEIYAILYNNKQSQMKARVEWSYNSRICSFSNVNKPHYQEVTIHPFSTVRVPFVILPTSLGYHDVQVTAVGEDVSDGIQKKIKVVPRGHILHNITSIVLEPALKGKDGVQVEKMTAPDSEDNINHKALIDTYFRFHASHLIETMETGIDGAQLDHLIKEVKGNGESNMAGLTALVSAALFLDASNQWTKLHGNRRNEAIQHMKSGIANQLKYRKSDFSYAQLNDRRSSTWLTAYVVKIFHLARMFTIVDTTEICNSIKWLLLDKLKPDGSFEESSPVSNQEMIGGNTGSSSELKSSLTAFVVAAILESQSRCEAYIPLGTIEKSTEFLKKVYPFLREPYSIAITSYALALAGKLQSIEKLMATSTGNYWNDPSSRFVSIEATSFALLTLIHLKHLNVIDRIVQRLTEQHFYGDTTGQIQATIMMFQALAQYYQVAPTIQDVDMEILLQFPVGRDNERFRIVTNKISTYSRQMSLQEDCTIIAKGKGLVTLTITQSYYSAQAKMDCDHYDLSVTAQEEYLAEKPKNAKSTVTLTICVRSKSLKSNAASVAVVEVVMLFGFVADTSSLNKLKESKDMSIDFNKDSYNKGPLILYLSKVPQTRKQCLVITAHQYQEVDSLQPATVTVYDYNTPGACTVESAAANRRSMTPLTNKETSHMVTLRQTLRPYCQTNMDRYKVEKSFSVSNLFLPPESENRCTKFYHIQEDNKDLGLICLEDICHCTEGNCYTEHQIDDNNPNFLYQKICDQSVAYAYKATVKDIKHRDNYSTYVMTIQRVFKEGADEVSHGMQRNFFHHRKCPKSLRLEKGRDYFIWGKNEDLWALPSLYSYIIGRDTWFEWFLNYNDCQNPQYTYLCERAQQLEEDLDFNGCVL